MESLLHAHEGAGNFLQQPAAELRKASTAKTGGAGLQGTAALSAAACAELFLGDSDGQTHERLETYLAGLPESLRGEVRERIEAALRVRQLSTRQARPAEEKEAAVRLPGFRVERKLGEGSLGAVYAAHDEKLNRRVAIKVLRRRDDSVLRQVLDEARKAAALADPAIVTIFSVLDESDPPAIVMELVEGFPAGPLSRRTQLRQKAHLLREMARGLAVAHEHGTHSSRSQAGQRHRRPGHAPAHPGFRPGLVAGGGRPAGGRI